MGDALRIAVKDLRLRVRDRSAFILGILAPVVLAYVFYLVFGTAASGEGLGLRYGLVDADRSDISMAFAEVLEGAQAEGVLELIVFNDTEEATAALDDGDIDAYFSIPEGLEEAIFANQSVTIDIVGDVDEPTSTQIAAAFARQFASGVAASQLAVATTATLQGIEVSPDVIAGLSSDPATAGMSFRLVDETATTKQLDTSTFFAAGMAVFFLFFTVQYGVTGLLEEEREGTLARLMAAPIPRSAVVAGKAICFGEALKPDFKRYAQAILDRLSSGTMHIELAPETEDTKTKALDLIAKTDGRPEPIGAEFLSGSQRFRVAVALALAIGQYAGRSRRPG